MHYNEYGGTVGGPVWIPKVYNGKQKTFFFFNYDGIRNQDPRFSTRSAADRRWSARAISASPTPRSGRTASAQQFPHPGLRSR